MWPYMGLGSWALASLVPWGHAAVGPWGHCGLVGHFVNWGLMGYLGSYMWHGCRCTVLEILVMGAYVLSHGEDLATTH